MESAETATTKSIAAKTASAVESAASAEMGITSVAAAKTVASAMVAISRWILICAQHSWKVSEIRERNWQNVPVK